MRKTIIENARRNVLQTIAVVGIALTLTWALFGCGGAGDGHGNGGNQQGTTVADQPKEKSAAEASRHD